MATTKPTAHLSRSSTSSSSSPSSSSPKRNPQFPQFNFPITTTTAIHMPPPAALRRSQRKLLLFFLKCIVMIAVISVFLFFLGFAAVVLLHFLLLSNRRHRRPAESAPSSSLAPDNVVYAEAEFPGFSDCAICLDSFEEGDVCRDLPDCKHLFHAMCVDRWIEKKPNCPVCRTRVDFGSTGSSGISGEERWKRLWVVNFEQGASIS